MATRRSSGQVARALRLAHRGDWRVAPENTIAALEAALTVPGCDGLEFDVRGSLDGIPVLLHDATLVRVQGVSRRVDELTAAELARHDVPTLAAALAAVGPRPFLDVELKGEPVPAVIDVLEAARGPKLDRAVISAFEPATLAWVGAERPTWRRWLNTEDLEAATVARARALGCEGIAAEWMTIGAGSAAMVRSAGLELAAWTVVRRPTIARLERLGVVAICVEGPALDG